MIKGIGRNIYWKVLYVALIWLLKGHQIGLMTYLFFYIIIEVSTDNLFDNLLLKIPTKEGKSNVIGQLCFVFVGLSLNFEL